MNEYDQIIREYFDISDAKTRKYIVNLEASDETQLLTALTSALYDKVVNKVDEIDFGSIPMSRGDITKIDGFDNTVECLNIMRKIVLEYKENPEIVDNVLGAINNIKDRKSLFIKAYSLNIEMPMLLYNLMVLAIEQSVSFLISVCIQYIKDPESNDINTALDKVGYRNAKNNLVYEQIALFNASCNNGQLDSSMNLVIKNGITVKENSVDIDTSDPDHVVITVSGDTNDPTKGSNIPKDLVPFDSDEPSDDFEQQPEKDSDDLNNVPVPVNGKCDSQSYIQPVDDCNGQPGIYGPVNASNEGAVEILKAVKLPFAIIKIILGSIIPLMRSITYFFISTRVNISDALAVQAQFIEANAAKLQYSTDSNLDENKKKKVIERQLKLAAKLRKWSNRFSIDNKQAEKNVQDQLKEDQKKSKIDDIKDAPGAEDIF